MGAGYQYIDQAMHDQYPWRILLLLGALKIVATSLSFVSGTPGGMFAPTLFIGAMIGGAVGRVEHHFFPWLTGSVGAYALVGMGTLFAGFLRVPMTSVFMVLEVSGNYSIILPVMISNTIAYLISRKYQRTPLFDLLSKQEGVDLPSMEERREEQALLVEDAMQPCQDPILSSQDSVIGALNRLEGVSGEFFFVEDGRGRWYGVTKDMLREAALAWDSDVAVGSILRGPPLPHVHPDHALDVALSRLGDTPFLPVVHRADLTKLEGIVSLQEILKAYRVAHAPIVGERSSSG
jgi:CIC family chloride channel protein